MSSASHRPTLTRTMLLAALGALALGCDPVPVAPADVGPGPVDGGPDSGPDCALDPLAEPCLPTPPVYEGPTSAIEVLRDSLGVPHVYAETDADAFFGSGYMQAYDRLFQMDVTRRRALGRRAEVLGEGYVDGDRTVRIMDMARWAEMNRRAMLVESVAEYELVQAWIAGINRRIEEVTTGVAPMPAAFVELGYEPEPWTEVDAFAVGRLILFGNAEQIQYDTLATIIRDVLPTLNARLPLLRPIRDTFVVPPEERPAARPITAAPDDLVPLPPLADRLDLAPPDLGARMTRFFDVLDGAFGEHGASNNWALEGRHTASGRPLIAGDPHQGLDSPSLMWLHHMHSAEAGGELDVAGFSFVGTPAVQLGHNRHLAWTATTTYPDWMDLWEVDWDVAASTVTLGGETLRVVPRTERILVRGEPAPREVVLEDVPGHGVLLPEDFFPIPLGAPGTRVLFDWTGFRPTHEAQGFFGFDVAATLDEFDAAADRNEVGAFNFVAASATGITYRSSPLVPVRAEPPGGTRAPWTMLDGDDVGTLWDGTFLRPGMELPHSRGGTRGWIVSANNEPLGLMEDGSADGDPFYFGVFFDPGVRAARIEDEIERLVARGGVTIEEMQTLQDDTHSEFADDLLPELTTAWDGRATDAALVAYRDRTDLDALVTLLRDWDRRFERTSSAAVAFHGFNFFLARRVLSDDFSLVFDPILGESPAFMFKFLVLALRMPDGGPGTFVQEGRSLLVVQALEDTASWLTTRFGSTDPAGYAWGDVHFTCFGAVVPSLDGGCVATDGGEGTVNVSGTSFFGSGGMPRERFESHGGSIYRLTAGFTAEGRPQAFINLPRGVSGEPTSPYWNDRTGDWAENRYRELLFERAEIEADALTPAGGGTISIAP